MSVQSKASFFAISVAAIVAALIHFGPSMIVQALPDSGPLLRIVIGILIVSMIAVALLAAAVKADVLGSKIKAHVTDALRRIARHVLSWRFARRAIKCVLAIAGVLLVVAGFLWSSLIPFAAMAPSGARDGSIISGMLQQSLGAIVLGILLVFFGLHPFGFSATEEDHLGDNTPGTPPSQ